ncbi:MAG: hypothetical protein WC998_04320 [Candidatus Paceibacterota bacterium]|jgi:hypothetical protein
MVKIKKNTLMTTLIMAFILVLLASVTYAFILAPNSGGKLPGLKIGQDDDTPQTSDGLPVGGVFSGPLAVSFTFLDHLNLDAVDTSANATVKIYHADKTSLFGTTSIGATITSQVQPSDHGKLWLLLQPAATRYVVADYTAAQSNYLGTASPYTVEGVEYYMFPFDVSSLKQVSGLTTPITLNIYQYDADVSGLTLNSLANATSADYSGTSWVTASGSGYLSGLTQEDSFKIAKIELSMPDAANISLLDNSHVKSLSVTIGLGNGQAPRQFTSYTHATGGSYIQFQTGIVDTTQEYQGIPVLYSATDATTSISYTVSCQLSGFTASDVWDPTLTITWIGPNGATGTVTKEVSFTDT